MKRYPAVPLILLVLICGGMALAADAPPAYVKHCASCHGTDGRGRTSLAIGKIPDLRSKAIVRLSDSELFNAIALGNVHKSYAHSFLNKGLTEPELRGIARYVRTIQGESSHATSAETTSSH